MKLWKIFRFELAYQIRRVSTWLYLIFLVAFAILMSRVTTPGDGVFANNTFYITGIIVMGTFTWLVMGAAVAGEAASRDVQLRIHPLIYSTPVSKFQYLGGRFLAAFVVNAMLLFSLPLAVLFLFYLPGLDQDGLLPFRSWAYLNGYVLIALPNAFVATALQFAFAALSRRVMTAYLASLLLAIFPQVIAGAAAKLFGNWDLVKLLDPVGVAGILGGELGTWTATEKNTRLISLEGMFLWNRILWLGVGVGALFLTYLRFSFVNPDTTSWLGRLMWWTKKAKSDAETTIAGFGAISVPQIRRSFGFTTYFDQTCSIAWAAFRNIAKSPVGLTLVGVMALASALVGSMIMTGLGIPLIPTTHQVLGYFAAPAASINTPWVVIPLLLMYFAAELVWRERDAGLGDMVDAAPVGEWVRFTGKFFALALIVVAWMMLLMAGGILMQLGLGYGNFELGLYIQAFFGLQLIDYLLFAILALVIHIIVNHKYIGYLVTLLVFTFMTFPSTFQIEHSLLTFGAGPVWSYTDMRGFGNTIWPWLWFKAYWTAWALLLAVIARLLWTRGWEQNFKSRLRLAQRRFTRATAAMAIITLALIVLLGIFIFYNTNVLNDYQTGSDVNERKAEYERRYGQFRNTLQPILTGTKLDIEIYPERQQVDIRAAYRLVNKSTVAIDTIHIGSVSNVALNNIIFSRPAHGVVTDKALGHYIYVLEQPLLPGESLQLSFEVNYRQRGFRHNGTDELVVKNGTSFSNYDLLPAVGYLPYREISDPVIRKKYNLAARPSLPSLFDADARKKPLSTDQSTFEAVVGTANDEVAVAPGRLQKTWTKGNRRYFHFKTDREIGGEYLVLSGKYAVQESKWNDVVIRIYYHPRHSENIPRMLRSVKASLEYFTSQFGAYPYRHMTVVERAGNGGGATADAGMISYGEQYSLMDPDDSRDGLDLPYYILAHEMAHQWWGIARLTPANVEGSGVLIEGLAVYSGMQVLEKNYGDGHLQKYVDYLHSSYEIPRLIATPSLLQANESFLYYRKGGLAMYALSKYIGKEKVNGALRNLLAKHDSGALPLPTTLDLYHELQRVTPDSLNYLLHDLFEKNTYWRLKTKQIAAEQIKGGKWHVTLKVEAHKVVIDLTGLEKEVPMHDLLEIGIYEKGKLNKPQYLRMHRVRSGEQIIKVTVPRKPDRGGIDPNYLMIDLRLEDNTMGIGG
jgi:ABC-2 type transport system permease protein